MNNSQESGLEKIFGLDTETSLDNHISFKNEPSIDEEELDPSIPLFQETVLLKKKTENDSIPIEIKRNEIQDILGVIPTFKNLYSTYQSPFEIGFAEQFPRQNSIWKVNYSTLRPKRV